MINEIKQHHHYIIDEMNSSSHTNHRILIASFSPPYTLDINVQSVVQVIAV